MYIAFDKATNKPVISDREGAIKDKNLDIIGLSGKEMPEELLPNLKVMLGNIDIESIEDNKNYLHKLRADSEVRKNSNLVCPLCEEKVFPKRNEKSNKYFFSHHPNNGSHCPFRGKGGKEGYQRWWYHANRTSSQHIEMQNFIGEYLKKDSSNFSDVKVESRYVGKHSSPKTEKEAKAWRFPDVIATSNNNNLKNPVNIIFEVQISPVAPKIIAERTGYYKDRGDYIVWVLSSFLKDHRSFKDDIFYTNNRNAFVLSEEAMSETIKTGVLHFEVYYDECCYKEGHVLVKHAKKVVPIHDLCYYQGGLVIYKGYEESILKVKQEKALDEQEREKKRLDFAREFWSNFKITMNFNGNTRNLYTADFYQEKVARIAFTAWNNEDNFNVGLNGENSYIYRNRKKGENSRSPDFIGSMDTSGAGQRLNIGKIPVAIWVRDGCINLVSNLGYRNK